eukprot:SAG25_NODE_224_length_11578_cov_10.606325_1_plen_1024_part_10
MRRDLRGTRVMRLPCATLIQQAACVNGPPVMCPKASKTAALDVIEAAGTINKPDRVSAPRRLQGNKKNVCFCLVGTPATGAACTTMNAMMCTRCDPGYSLNRLTQSCDPNVCLCPNGAPATGHACLVKSKPKCMSCNPGFKLVNGNECRGFDCKGTPTQGPGKPNKNRRDACGVCNGDGASCAWDCTGLYQGYAKRDVCGICNGNNSTCDDCKGIPNGPNTRDYCGTCDDNPRNDCPIPAKGAAAPSPAKALADCAGKLGGTAYEDKCGRCDDDVLNDCRTDCKGFWGGNATIDACGVCGGNGMSCAAKDCNGVPGGKMRKDICGVCGGNGNLCKTKVCNGQHGSKCGSCINFQKQGHFTVLSCQSVNYHIFVPSGCWQKSCGLIFDIPGRGMSGKDQADTSGVREAALTKSKLKFIVVNPDKSSQSWISTVDHPKILQFLQLMVSIYGVDKTHIHVTGYDQGGFAAWNMLCLSSQLICSIAPLAAPPFGCLGANGARKYHSTCFASAVPATHAKRSILFQYGKYDLTCGSGDIVSAVHSSVTKAYGTNKPTKMKSCKIRNADRMEFYDTTSKLTFQTIQYPYTSMPGLGHCFPRMGLQPSGRLCQSDLLGNDPQYDSGELIVDFFRNNPCRGWAGSCANGALIAWAKRTQNDHCGKCNAGYILSAKRCIVLKTCPAGKYLAGHSILLSNPGACRNCPSGTFKPSSGTYATTCTAFKPCPPGQQLTGESTKAPGKCVPCPASTYNAVRGIVKCSAMDVCTNGEYQKTPGTSTKDRICASHGTCNANEYEVKPPTATTDRLCSGAGTCANGMLIAQPLRKQANHCGRCFAGYTLGSRKCMRNSCICINGTPKTGAACTKNGSSMCQSCRAGYVLSTIACTAKSCDALAVPANGAKGTCTTSLASGSSCAPTCTAGYTVSGKTSCMLGKLAAATCKPKPCDASAPPANGAKGDCSANLPSGGTCLPTCNSGYTVSGQVSCKAGTLTPASCVPNPCDALAVPANGAKGTCTTSLASGSSCAPTCTAG